MFWWWRPPQTISYSIAIQVWGDLLRGTCLQSSNRFPDLEHELMVASGERPGERIVREFGMDMYTLLYLKWIINKNQLYSTGNSVQCHAEAWTRGEFGGRMDTCICMAESLHCAIWNYHNIVNWLFVVVFQLLSLVQLFATHQAPQSMGFSRQEYWSGLPFPCQEIFPDQRSNPHLLHWQADSLLLCHQGSCNWLYFNIK